MYYLTCDIKYCQCRIHRFRQIKPITVCSVNGFGSFW
jgi:hypothetical protein